MNFPHQLIQIFLFISITCVTLPSIAHGEADGPSQIDSKTEIEKTETPEELPMATIAKDGSWLGLAGLATMVVADQLRYPYIRTIGNGALGLAWATALGAYGVLSDPIKATSYDIEKLLSESDNRFRRASGQGAIGESSNLFLIPEGAYFHPVYNDVNGNTDKLLTASLKIGLLRSWDQSSLETVAYWRLLTPAVKREFNTPDFKKPVGRYADWSEIKTSWAHLWNFAPIKMRSQISVGYNHIGDKGGQELHVAIHRITQNSLENLEYINQPEGQFFSWGAELGALHPIYADKWGVAQGSLAFTGEFSRMMNEVGIRWNATHIVVPELWEYALETRFMRQVSSEAYDNIKPWRYEGAIGVRIMENFTPTLKYISAYLDEDDVGQTYFDLLHYNAVF